MTKYFRRISMPPNLAHRNPVVFQSYQDHQMVMERTHGQQEHSRVIALFVSVPILGCQRSRRPRRCLHAWRKCPLWAADGRVVFTRAKASYLGIGSQVPSPGTRRDVTESSTRAKRRAWLETSWSVLRASRRARLWAMAAETPSSVSTLVMASSLGVGSRDDARCDNFMSLRLYKVAGRGYG